VCNFCLFLSSLHGTPQMIGGWLMGHQKEELVSMMCYLESSVYNFVHSISIVCTFCAGGLQCIRRVCVCTDFHGRSGQVSWLLIK